MNKSKAIFVIIIIGTLASFVFGCLLVNNRKKEFLKKEQNSQLKDFTSSTELSNENESEQFEISNLELLNLARSRARDVKRGSDLRQFADAQEKYYIDHGNNYKTADTQDNLPAIGGYIDSLDDPLSNEGRHYKFLENKKCPQNYCVFAILENNEGCDGERFLAASEKGVEFFCKTQVDFTKKTDGCSCW